MKVLVHICCAPCFAYPHQHLEDMGHTVTGYWYNPNIHPTLEYNARRNALDVYAKLENVDIVFGEYDILGYMTAAVTAMNNNRRCESCYHIRLSATAQYAHEHNYDAFTTTMLVSHQQKHNSIRDIGEQVANEWKVPFYYEDFRSGWPQGRAIAIQYGLYRQKYCGCLFSEWERYRSIV